MLPFEEEKLGVVGFVGFGFRVRVLGGIADEEGHVVVDDEGDVEGGCGFGSGRPEPGLGEVPEEVGVVGELLGAVFFPEDEGLDVEVEGGERRERGWGIEGVVVEVEVEGATQKGA